MSRRTPQSDPSSPIDLTEDEVPDFSDFGRPKPEYTADQDLDLMLVDIDATIIAEDAAPRRFREPYSKSKDSHNRSKATDGASRTAESEVRLYCLDRNEVTYMIHVLHFRTYFYVALPAGLAFSSEVGFELRAKLNEDIGEDTVVAVELVDRLNLTSFRLPDEGMLPFLKVTVLDHSKLSKCREIFDREFYFQNHAFDRQTFDSNLDYRLRFMVDKGLAGNSWFRVPACKHTRRTSDNVVSNCGVEIDVEEVDIVGHKPADPAWAVIAPMRIMAFDIEVENTIGFPVPQNNQVITIACSCRTHDAKAEERRVVFQLNTCDKIFDTSLYCFAREKDMLEAFDAFITAYDPDIILGYNIISFDLNYLLERRSYLGLTSPSWGRLLATETTVRKDKFQSKMMGFRELLNINTPGRIQIDMLAHMMREKKLRSYSLNYVSFYFMGEQKEDVSYKIISQLQNESPITRKRIATYCLKDAQLPLRLFDKLKCIYSYVEMARVTGVPITYLLFKGQQIKIVSQLYRTTRQKGFVVPYFKKKFAEDGEVGYQGADVLEPKRGFYDVPIATLDFASLYPSIMISHNMCYSTLLRGGAERGRFAADEVHVTPAGYTFVKKEVRRGLLPEILENLLSARKQARQEMEATKTLLAGIPREPEHEGRIRDLENLVSVLDGRQLALKISANSVYGFTGASVGSLPSLEVASSVTSIGREMIDKTKNYVLRNFNRANGFQENADVIYGDTDSVMINFGVNDVAEAMRLGKLAAERLSAEYLRPIKLEFEKVYYPYLLLAKKRYAGLLWTKPERPDKKDMKGVESVRRDNCQLASTMVDKVLDILLVEKNVEKAKAFTKSQIADLLSNNVDISMLIISKGVSRDIEGDNYKVKMPHIELIKRLKARNNEVKFAVGDRIPFVILSGAAGSKNYENSEDPEHAFVHSLPLDTNYYLEKQIKPPLERIFEVICDTREIFEGQHTMKTKTQGISDKVGMGKFFSKAAQCMSCKRELKGADLAKALCSDCAGRQNDLYIKKVMELKACEADYSRLWSECQRCDGTLMQEVRCNNSDCIIYFRRTKTKKDIQAAYKLISRMD